MVPTGDLTLSESDVPSAMRSRLEAGGAGDRVVGYSFDASEDNRYVVSFYFEDPPSYVIARGNIGATPAGPGTPTPAGPGTPTPAGPGTPTPGLLPPPGTTPVVSGGTPTPAPTPYLALLEDPALEVELTSRIRAFAEAIEAEDISLAMAPFKKGPVWEGIDHYERLHEDFRLTFERFDDMDFAVEDPSFRAWDGQVISMFRFTLKGLRVASGETGVARRTFMWLWEEGDDGWQVVDSVSLPEERTWEELYQ